MSDAPAAQNGPSASPSQGEAGLAVVLVVFVSFLAYSAVRYPVPGVNEPHYLTKAKHYWDRDFCRGDFFVESRNAHVVFYQTVGLLTKWFSLEQTAWIARSVAFFLLAVGWTGLVSSVVPGRWPAAWTAWFYLALGAAADCLQGTFVGSSGLRIFDLAGEWLLDGVEAKVFAYAFLLMGMAAWLRRRRNWVAACFGLAVSFHPVVGIWGVAAAAFAGMMLTLWNRAARQPIACSDGCKSSWPCWVIGCAIFAATAAPGLIPAMGIVETQSPQLAFNADYIQVYYRLSHHLDPMTIPLSAWLGHLGLAAIWLVGRYWVQRSENEKWFTLFVVGCILILLGGLYVGYRTVPPDQVPGLEWRARLLKFYPFRLADVFIPLAAAVTLAGLAQRFSKAKTSDTVAANRSRTVTDAAFSAFLGCFVLALVIPGGGYPHGRLTNAELADWIDACKWIAQNAPRMRSFSRRRIIGRSSGMPSGPSLSRIKIARRMLPEWWHGTSG